MASAPWAIGPGHRGPEIQPLTAPLYPDVDMPAGGVRRGAARRSQRLCLCHRRRGHQRAAMPHHVEVSIILKTAVDRFFHDQPLDFIGGNGNRNVHLSGEAATIHSARPEGRPTTVSRIIGRTCRSTRQAEYRQGVDSELTARRTFSTSSTICEAAARRGLKPSTGHCPILNPAPKARQTSAYSRADCGRRPPAH